LASRQDVAVPIVREALRLHEEKGNEVSAARALAVLELLGAKDGVKAL
jgi:hypothetical protein